MRMRAMVGLSLLALGNSAVGFCDEAASSQAVGSSFSKNMDFQLIGNVGSQDYSVFEDGQPLLTNAGGGSAFSLSPGISFSWAPRSGSGFGADLSLAYLRRDFLPREDGPIQVSLTTVDFAPVARHWISRNFSVGLGGFIAVGVGDVEIYGKADGEGRRPFRRVTYDEFETRRLNYGVLGSTSARLFVSQSSSLALELRYRFGFSNTDPSKQMKDVQVRHSSRDFQALLGYGIQL